MINKVRITEIKWGQSTVNANIRKNYALTLLLILTVFILTACQPLAKTDNSSRNLATNYRFGWMHGNCLAITDAIDILSSSFFLVDLDSRLVSKMSLGHKAVIGDECYALLDDRATINKQNSRQFYTVVSDKPVNLAIGIVYMGGDSPAIDTIMDTNKDGKIDNFVSCSTSEGMIFSIWDGEAYKSNLIWSDYYYLGYDSEADCPDFNQ